MMMLSASFFSTLFLMEVWWCFIVELRRCFLWWTSDALKTGVELLGCVLWCVSGFRAWTRVQGCSSKFLFKPFGFAEFCFSPHHYSSQHSFLSPPLFPSNITCHVFWQQRFVCSPGFHPNNGRGLRIVPVWCWTNIFIPSVGFWLPIVLRLLL